MTRMFSLITLASALLSFQMPSFAGSNEAELKTYSADEAMSLDLGNLTDADKLSDMLDDKSFQPRPPGGNPGPRPGNPGPRPQPPGNPGPRPPYNPGPRPQPPYNPGPRPQPPYNPGPHPQPPYNPGPRPPYNPGPRPVPPPYYPPRPVPVPPPYYPPYPYQPYVTCYSQNYRGDVFAAAGYDYSINIQQQALDSCYRAYDSYGCRELGCQY